MVLKYLTLCLLYYGRGIIIIIILRWKDEKKSLGSEWGSSWMYLPQRAAVSTKWNKTNNALVASAYRQQWVPNVIVSLLLHNSIFP